MACVTGCLKNVLLAPVRVDRGLFPMSTRAADTVGQKALKLIENIFLFALNLSLLTTRLISLVIVKAQRTEPTVLASYPNTKNLTNSRTLTATQLEMALTKAGFLKQGVPPKTKAEILSGLKTLEEKYMKDHPKIEPNPHEKKALQDAFSKEWAEVVVNVANVAETELRKLREKKEYEGLFPLELNGRQFDDYLVHLRHVLNVCAGFETQEVKGAPNSINGKATFGGYKAPEGTLQPYLKDALAPVVGSSVAADALTWVLDGNNAVMGFVLGSRREGAYAVCGGFQDSRVYNKGSRKFGGDNDVFETSGREREEENNIPSKNVSDPYFVGLFSDSLRDFRNVISAAFAGFSKTEPRAGDDLKTAFIVPIEFLKEIIAYELSVWIKYEEAYNDRNFEAARAAMKESCLSFDHGRLLIQSLDHPKVIEALGINPVEFAKIKGALIAASAA